MKKVILGDALGVFVILFGVAIALVYFQNQKDSSPLLLAAPAIMIILGLLLFFGRRMHTLFSRINKFDTSMTKKEIAIDSKKFGNQLKKNNDLVEEWAQTNKTREELKLLQAADAANSEEK
jgi:hypothetical protein